MFYLSIMFLLYLLCFFEQLSLKKHDFIKIFFFVLFFSLSAFRYKTGLDWIGYLDFYNKISSGADTIQGIDIGYIYLMRFFNFFNFDYYYMQIFIALFSTTALFIFFYDNSKYPLFCLASYFFIYYLRYNMGLQRQVLALSFCMFSFYYFKRDKIMVSILLWGISVLFHFSSLIFLIVFIERHISLSVKKQIFFILGFIFIVGVLKINVVNICLNFLLKVSNILNLSFISNKILFYINDDYYSKCIPLGKFLVIKSFLITYIFYKLKNIKENYLYLLSTTYIIIACLSHQFYVLDRLDIYFQIFAIIVFSYFFDIFYIKINKIIVLTLLTFIFCWPNIRNFMFQKEERYYFRYIPYYSIFNKKDDIQRFKAENGDIK